MTAPLRSHGAGKPPRRRVILRFTVLAWLTGVWVLLWGTWSWANVLGGFAVALLVTLLLPLPPVAVQGRVRFLAVAKLIAVVAYYSIMSSLQSAWLAIRIAAPPETGVMRRQVSIRSDLVFTLMVDALNLVPGTIVIDIDTRRRLLYIHVLDLGSDRAVEQFSRIVTRYEQLFKDAFERDADWAPDTRALARAAAKAEAAKAEAARAEAEAAAARAEAEVARTELEAAAAERKEEGR